MTNDVTVQIFGAEAGRVAVVTLNRPSRRNAYTAEMGRLLGQAYRACDDDDAVRAIVLTGAGSAFCVGADFDAGQDPFGSRRDDETFSASPIDPAAFELRTPVIAAVNGHAIGIGLTMALQADIRIFAEDAKCGVVQVRRGVLGDCMSHWTLPHLAGAATAADLLLTGRTFSGSDAPAMGIATRALPAPSVLPHALDIAHDIAENVAPMSAALSKRLLWDAAINGWTAREVASVETQLHQRVMGTADSREGVEAFMARRRPRWTSSVVSDWEELPAPKPTGDSAGEYR
jgi:enoyl-CoA hydratase/carnithine racemase